MTKRSMTGHCLCKAVDFEIGAEPLSANFCHCESCRRQSGSAVAAFVSFPKEAVSWRGSERATYRSSPAVTRSFCPRCGSSLAYEHDDLPEEIDIYLGVLDDPGRYHVDKHVHYGERVAWFDTIDRTPRYRAASDCGELPVATESAAPAEAPRAIGPAPPVDRG